MWSLRPEHFKMIYCAVPPREEQDAIVRLLDHANSQLERAIRAKKRLIALLNERKQAIIHRVVTRGLDPNVRLKYSGIPWLGDVPEQWDVRRAKYVYREVDERSTDGNEELLSVSHITGITPRSEKNITMFKAASYVGHKICRPGDLVVNTMWAWMGAMGVSKYTGIVSPSYAVYRPLQAGRMLGEYFDHLLRARPYVSEYICRSTGIRSSRLRLYPEQFFRIPVAIPSREEQTGILEWISEATEHLDSGITRAQREVDLIHEYRVRLTTDVVTGQLDVRDAARRIPAEKEEPEEPAEVADDETEDVGEAVADDE
jgi:type I restriction enzyme S subunit